MYEPCTAFLAASTGATVVSSGDAKEAPHRAKMLAIAMILTMVDNRLEIDGVWQNDMRFASVLPTETVANTYDRLTLVLSTT